MIVNFTDAAVSRIKEMMAAEEETGLFLRVGVKGGGCSGLSYGMGFDKETQSTDHKEETNGLKVVVDAESAKILNGTTVDFKQNMMGGGFTINNPNAIASCGCGSSFRTAVNAGSPEEC